jgi:hypothetical protein
MDIFLKQFFLRQFIRDFQQVFFVDIIKIVADEVADDRVNPRRYPCTG